MIGMRFDLPFAEQLAFFRSKGFALSPASWRDVWQEAHARSFTVARVTAMDVLEDIRAAIDESMETGTTLTTFKAGLQETLERKGWLAPAGERAEVKLPDGTTRKRLTGWRLDTNYGTNMQAAYSTGRYKQQREVKDTRPYWQYHTAGDIAVRPSHAAMNGCVFHADHVVWRDWYPSNGHNCRCYVSTLSPRQMKARGLTEQIRGVAQRPDEGFRYNPGAAGLAAWRPDLSGYGAGARELLDQELGKKEYRPASTLREAEDWAKREMGIADILYSAGSESRDWGRTTLNEAGRLKTLNAINAEWDRLRSRYPKLRCPLDRIYVLGADRGRATLGGDALSVARALTEEEITFTRSWEKTAMRRWEASDPARRSEGNFRHELGHILSTRPVHSSWERACGKMQPGQRKSWFTKNISEYASENASEELAESFCLYTGERYKTQILPRELEKIIKSMLE